METTSTSLLTSIPQSSRREIANPFAVARKKKKAQKAVLKAIRAGILVRPSQCSECPKLGTIEAHHDNYDDPLRVRWLCASCHHKADEIRRQSEGYVRPVCHDFAEFLSVRGEVTLPFYSDPPVVVYNTWSCAVSRAIRSIRFAGLNSKRQPLVAFVLSCGHVEIAYTNVLLQLPAIRLCAPCTHSKERILRERAERRNERRRAKRAGL